MRSIHRTAEVAYTPTQMFDLVNDVESYPQFLHWCHAARIERSEGDIVEAALEIGLAGVYKTMRTRNRLERPERISIELLAGPFRHLEGEWHFKQRASGGCEVELLLSFDMTSSPLNMVFVPLFEEIVRTQVTAFVERAAELYG